MYNFLIVDDEELICDSLFQIYSNQQDLNLEISQAYSAIEALELLNNQRFDIVMTDIEMPGMSGIELMKEINSRWINCKIIFLTAHTKFDYIYTTKQYKNTRYLLKTEKIEKIIQTIKDVIAELEQDNYSAALLERITVDNRIDRERYNRYLMTDLIQGNILSAQINLEILSTSDFRMHLNEQVYLFLGVMDRSMTTVSNYETAKWSDTIIKEVEECFSSSCICLGTILEMEYLVWLVQPSDFSHYIEESAKNKLCFSLINGNLPVIQTIIHDSLGISLSFAVSSEALEWDAISDAYRGLKQQFFYNHGAHNGEILLYSISSNNMAEERRTMQEMQSDKKVEQLERLIREGNQGLIENYFERIVGENSSDFTDTYYLYVVFSTISLELVSILNRYGLTQIVDKKYPVKKLISFNMHLTWISAIEYLKMVALEITALRETYSESAVNRVIGLVNQYINENLDKELSLTKLAEMIHYNPAYLSRIYKDITGENIKKYISNAKIERSKKFLSDSNLKISEVSEKVGFDRPANFGRFFKENMGMSPQRYREIYCESKI